MLGDKAIAGTDNSFRRYLGLSLDSKSARYEAHHSSPSRLLIKNEWISASNPHVFMECKGRVYVLFACVVEKLM